MPELWTLGHIEHMKKFTKTISIVSEGMCKTHKARAHASPGFTARPLWPRCSVKWILPLIPLTFAAAALFCETGCGLASRQFTYAIADGSVTITKYIGSAPSVVIPRQIHGLPVTSIGMSAFGVREIVNSQNLTNVIIPDTVRNIGAEAFANCTRLASLTIPDSVTNIGVAAFADCKSLTRVTIPDNVTTVGEGAFTACIGLTEVTIGNGVTSVPKEMFVSCIHLSTVTIGTNVTVIGPLAFWLCSDLAAVTILGPVTDVGTRAFMCPRLKAVYFTGNAPRVFPQTFSPTATLYYRSGTEGWGATFDGCRTAPWKQ